MSKHKATIWINLYTVSVILCALGFVGAILSIIWDCGIVLALFLISIGLIMLVAQAFCYSKAVLEKHS